VEDVEGSVNNDFGLYLTQVIPFPEEGIDKGEGGSMGKTSRSEKILAELGDRYGLEERFVEKLAPILEVILGDSFSDEERLPLLEELAETCQRDQMIRQSMADARQGIQDLFDRLKEWILRMHQGE
jgi:hypothetical protein